MPPRVRKTHAAPVAAGPLRRSPRIAEKRRQHEEEALRLAQVAEAETVQVQTEQAATPVTAQTAAATVPTDADTTQTPQTPQTPQTVQATTMQTATETTTAPTAAATIQTTPHTPQTLQTPQTLPATQPVPAAPVKATTTTSQASTVATTPSPLKTPPSSHYAFGTPLTADTIPAPDYLQSLLPGGLFFGYAAVADDDDDQAHVDSDGRPFVWSVPREQALLRRHWGPDQRRLQRHHHRLFDSRGPAGPYGPRLLATELGLWDALQHRFRCGLDDLFRYGLRPEWGKDADTNAEKEAAARIRYCRNLTAILVHPIWSPADLAAVRWMLQRVVQTRVAEEEEVGRDGALPAPVVPPYSYSRPPFVDTARQWAGAVARRRRLTADAEGEAAATATAAAEAEAQLTWFLFAAHMPHDLYLLFNALGLPEATSVPRGRRRRTIVIGVDSGGSEDDSDSDSDADSTASGASARRFRRLLRACSTIGSGDGFGAVDAHDNPDAEVILRFNNRQAEDRRAEAAAAAAAAAAGAASATAAALTVPPGSTTSAVPGFTISAVPDSTTSAAPHFSSVTAGFPLQEQDLDRLLAIMARPDILEQAGFPPPGRHAADFARMHTIYSQGVGTHAGPLSPPTCHLCLMAFHNEGPAERKDDHGHDHDHDCDCDSVGPGPLDDHIATTAADKPTPNSSPLVPDHDHYFHQHYIGDVPQQHAVAWLLERKGAWLLSAHREEAIWRARQEASMSQDDKKDVPDIPPFDPSPQAHLNTIYTDASQLAALMGCRRLGREHAAARWCFGSGGQARTETETE